MTRPEVLGLLADIMANPEDDTPRLVYSDWLDDAGKPERAELIRVQVDLYRLEEGVYDEVVSHLSLKGHETPRAGCLCRPCQLRRRERCAWRAKGILDGPFVIAPALMPGWGMPDYLWSEYLWPQRPALLWRRGFPHTVRCPLDVWIAKGREVVYRHPICRVEPTDCTPWEGREHRDDADPSHFGWWAPMDAPERGDTLPVPLLDVLARDPRRVRTPADHLATSGGTAHGCVMFASPKDAVDALSDVLLMVAHDPRLLEDPDPKRTARPRVMRK